MKIHKPIRLFVPKSIWAVIDSTVKTKKEIYVYLINYILYKPVTDRRYENFVPLNKEKLSSLIGCNVTPYIKYLEKYELIESDGKAIAGQKSFYYRIHQKYKFDCNYFELQPDTTLFKNIINQIKNEKTNYSKLEPFLDSMRKEFMSLQFNYKDALNWLENVSDEQKKVSYSIAINQLNDHRFRYFKRNGTNNRLDTNLTNLKKDLRQFINGDYVSIDLKNSQPFLLGFLLEKIAKILNYFNIKKLEFNQYNIEIILNNKHLPYCYRIDLLNLIDNFGIQTVKQLLLIRKKQEIAFFTNLSMYKRWVTEGIFYDEFIKKFDNLTRDDVKKIMFEVLFSNNRITHNYRTFIPFEKEKKIFSNVFPIIYSIVERLKDNDNSKLAIYLQKLESEIFIDKVAKNLVEARIVPFTIHDSIIVPTQQQETALNIIQSVFKNEIGIVPKFHIELI